MKRKKSVVEEKVDVLKGDRVAHGINASLPIGPGHNTILDVKKVSTHE